MQTLIKMAQEKIKHTLKDLICSFWYNSKKYTTVFNSHLKSIKKLNVGYGNKPAKLPVSTQLINWAEN